MATFKKCKVLLLPTNEEATDKPFSVGITLCNDYKLRIGNPVGKSESRQHLYITSDDEIKEGDWYSDGTYINKADTTYSLEVSKHIKAKKIIATTDKSTAKQVYFDGVPTDNYSYVLPQPSQLFIEKYVEEYNKGHIISNVMVEYELPFIDDDIFANHNPILKVNPKDNTITIKKVKDSYSREEVEKLIYRAIVSVSPNPAKGFIDNWIEENL